MYCTMHMYEVLRSSGSGKEKPGNIAAKKSLEVCFFLGVCGVCHACCMVSLGYPEQA